MPIDKQALARPPEQDDMEPAALELRMDPDQMNAATGADQPLPVGTRCKVTAEGEVTENGVIALSNLTLEPAQEEQAEDPNALRGELEKNLAAQTANA